MGKQESKPSFFDVSYAIPSPTLTAGVTVVATTAGNYLGMMVHATSAGATVIVYDHASTDTGRRLDILTVTADAKTRIDSSFMLRAKNGLTVNLTGTGALATIFYSPLG